MRGHRQIIAARRDGYKPSQVFVDLVDEPRPGVTKYDEPENGLRLGCYPHVEVLRREVGAALDFRFLVGLTVHVHGQEMDETMGVLLDLIEAQAPEKLVACAGDALMFFNHGIWQAWTF